MDPRRPYLYTPIDPKYLYPATNHLSCYGYPSDSAFTGEKAQPFGYELDQFMFHKQEIILSRIHLLHSEIYQRYNLKNENLYRIDLDQCTCRNLIFLIGEDSLDRKRLELERKIIDLEQEKRREKAGFFKDILFLRKELRETLIEKLQEEQKAKLFIDEGR